jgi:DegT/DnrJ/EryC1/StrS aminotransferase family
VTRISFLPLDHAPARPASSVSGEALAMALAQALGHDEVMLTASGRAAMASLFHHLQFRPEHDVYVTTTFGYSNVSSCVTSTIFNFCKPSRVLTSQTRAVFVIHEFGVPHAGTPALRRETTRRGIPLIEDCAHGIGSVAHEGWRVGELADWVIVSLPKLLPAPSGGLLVGRSVAYAPSIREDRAMQAAVGAAAAWWPSWHEQVRHRQEVYRSLAKEATKARLRPLFEVSENLCPWLFPVRVPCPEDVQQAARECLVDCGLWHGSDLVVFPCHQFLSDDDVGRIGEVLKLASRLATTRDDRP